MATCGGASRRLSTAVSIAGSLLGGRGELQWAEWVAEELLEEVLHRQVVLTLPKRLRISLRFDRRLLGEPPGCAWRALRLYLAACFGRDDVTPGAVGFVQTAGELLGWHPHLHVLLADGG